MSKTTKLESMAKIYAAMERWRAASPHSVEERCAGNDMMCAADELLGLLGEVKIPPAKRRWSAREREAWERFAAYTMCGYDNATSAAQAADRMLAEWRKRWGAKREGGGGMTTATSGDAASGRQRSRG